MEEQIIYGRNAVMEALRSGSAIDTVYVQRGAGGLGKLISEATDAIDIYDPELTLHGLRIIYDKQ